ncbi:membrane bound O-acyl transferase family-domain-containing protein [Xylariaceae sp. FL1651]|nr:membrane bound O-acyl transferase family-domain-containing protein [Xylariaceae sp. FL1651]
MQAPIREQEHEVGLREPKGSITPHLFLLACQVALLAGPRFRGRRHLACGLVVGLAVACHMNQFTQNLALANLFSLAWPHYLTTFINFAFASYDGPEADLWPVDDAPRVATTWAAFSGRKVSWALSTMINLRGVQWSYEVPHLPRRVSEGVREPRAKFLLLQLVDLGWMLLMSDMISRLGLKLFFTDPATGSIHLNSRFLTLRSSNPLWSIAKAFIFGAGPYFFINAQYVACSVLAVALGLGAPKDWPPLFGKLSEAWTVRRFWNRFWHQMIRRPLTALSEAAVSHMNIEKGSTTSTYLRLWIAFAISGIMHAGSMVILPSPANLTLADRTVGIFCFFVWQAVAITLEDLMQWVWKLSRDRVGGQPVASSSPPLWVTVLGYVWVVASFWFSLPMAGGVMLKLRMGQDTPLPVSAFGWLINHVRAPLD